MNPAKWQVWRATKPGDHSRPASGEGRPPNDGMPSWRRRFREQSHGKILYETRPVVSLLSGETIADFCLGRTVSCD